MSAGPDPYGGGLPQYPGGVPQQPTRPTAPSTVQTAFRLLIAGGAVQALGIVAGLAQIGTIRDEVEKSLRENNANVTQDTIDAAVALGIGLTVVLGLIYVGLWIWMAFANRAGKNWARITGTVFFAILTLLTLGSIATVAAGSAGNNAYSAGSASVPGLVIGIVNWAIGLAALIMLWNRKSSDYFKPQPPYSGYTPY